MMHELIRGATGELCTFLSNHLPALGERWWTTHVADRLSFQQQRTVEEHGLTKLEELDFAALLRILDQNWYEFSQALNLPREGRTWVRELQAVRNRWAHLSASPMPAEDLYRDADTLARVLDMLGAAPAFVAAVAAVKKDALSDMTVPSDAPANSTLHPANTAEPTAPSSDPEMPAVAPQSATTMFKVGDLVALRSDPDTVVPIIGVMADTAETRYQVFQNNRQATYYESQLRPFEPADKPSLLSADDLRAHLTSLHLLSPSTANLYSLRSGRVHFVPYQYRPVVRLIRADRPRLLIADEVGVGKTIEAGLIIKELRARTDISSVLVICPKVLVTERKWYVEMKRFDEHFEALDGRTLRHCLRETDLEGEWPDRYARAIIPFSLFDSDLLFGKKGRGSRAGEGLLALDPPPRFDLVIVDEAHHIRNADTYLHQAVRYFCDNAQAAVFLTATPVQLGSQDLFTLLNVLRPDLVIDRPSFEQMAAPNGFINAAVGHCRTEGDHWQAEARACLGHAAQTEWGRLFLRESPAFQDIYDRLAEENIDDASRIRIIRSLEELYTFSPMINRTRRRDIGEFTTRRPETLTVEFTPDQRRLHDDLLDVVSRILARAHGEQNVKFMMTTVRRQAASCLYGLAPLLRDMLAGKLDSLEAMDETNGETPVDAAFLTEIRADIEALLERADDLDPVDPKVQAFVTVLRDKDRMANNKAMAFSTFRHTLAYIEKHVADAGLRYGLVHGGVPDDQRAELRRRFALPKDDPEALDVLLSVKRLSILTPDRRAKLTPLSGNRAAGTAGGGSGAVLEAPALVAGLDDLAMMGKTVEQRGGHLGVAEDGRPFAEGEVGGDDDRGALVEPAHEVEAQLPAGLGEGQVAEFVEDDEVAAYELICGAALASGAELGLEVVDQVDDVVAAAAGALADAGAGDGDGEMGLAGAGAADQHDVALALQEAAAGELLDQGLVDWRGGEVEVGQLLGRWQPGGRHLVLDGARRLVGDLGLQQRTDDLLHRMTALETVGEDVVVGGAHARELQRRHHRQHLMTLHDRPPSSDRSADSRPPAGGEAAGPRASGWSPAVPAGTAGRGC